MPAQDTSKLKEKIISILKIKGPSLPVHIARETGLSMLFASAFLSELFSEKKIKISNMKVGNSPIYFISGQESRLEKFSQYLKSKEKEAFILLKEKKFLKDKEQEPAIRVALRAIKDFAIPFKKDEEIFWRYFTTPENKFKKENIEKAIIVEPTLKKSPLNLTESKQKIQAKQDLEQTKSANDSEQETKEKHLNLFDKPIKKKKSIKKKKTQKQNEKLFNKVKEFLSKENIEMLNLQSLSRNELILKVREQGERKLLIAYNKKRITDLDLVKTYKKLDDKNIPYILLSLGNPSKKLINLIEVIKKLDKIKKIEK